jgi:hypothetical protein
VGSKTFDGVWFISYSLDHAPPHVHGSYGATTVIVDLLADGSARRSKRKDSVKPRNAKQNDIRKILRTANEYEEVLIKLWETTHGKKT